MPFAVWGLVLVVGVGWTAEVKPGYADLFIELDNFTRIIAPAKVSKDGKVYSQTAHYLWNGGRYETIRITLARDPAFKDQFSDEALKKQAPQPKEFEVGKKKALLWRYQPDKFDALAAKLVVVLSADRAILIEQHGGGLDLDDVAQKLDFAKVEKALEAAPKLSEK